MITLNSIITKYIQSHLDRSQTSMPFFSGMELKVRYSGFVCDQPYNTFQQVHVSVCHLLQLPSAIQAWSSWVTHVWKQHHRQHYRTCAWKSWAFCLRWFLPMWLVWTYIQHCMDLQLAVDPYKKRVLFESMDCFPKTHIVSWHISANQISTKHSPTVVVWCEEWELQFLLKSDIW